MDNKTFLIGLALSIIGFLFLVFSGYSIRLKSIKKEKLLDSINAPSLIIGIILLIIGITVIYFYYPFN